MPGGQVLASQEKFLEAQAKKQSSSIEEVQASSKHSCELSARLAFSDAPGTPLVALAAGIAISELAR